MKKILEEYGLVWRSWEVDRTEDKALGSNKADTYKNINKYMNDRSLVCETTEYGAWLKLQVESALEVKDGDALQKKMKITLDEKKMTQTIFNYLMEIEYCFDLKQYEIRQKRDELIENILEDQEVMEELVQGYKMKNLFKVSTEEKQKNRRIVEKKYNEIIELADAGLWELTKEIRVEHKRIYKKIKNLKIKI